MVDGMYPICGECNKGTLLPFYSKDGTNIYACTRCLAKFGPVDKNGIVSEGSFRLGFGYVRGKVREER